MSTARQPADDKTERLLPVPIRGAAGAAGAAGPRDPDATGPVAPAGGLPTVRGYELLGELGRGGMGVVYLAVQQGLRRRVAIKMLPPGAAANPLDVARFFGEAEAVAAVKHPHVVQIHEFALHESRPFMAMEHLSGGSLAARLRAGPLPADDAARLAEKLARAVQAAHEQGVVHRDLKPGNVLFDAEGEPRVTDFGLAKHGASDLTQTREVMGTPAYMAPEQASGRTKYAGPAADVYALGVILYECLTGAPPFEHAGADAWPVLHRVIHEPPAAPSRAARVPLDLDLICLRCLEKGPADRYPTAAALADDLARFLNRQPVSVRPPGPVERGLKWARRRPAAATACAAAAALTAALATGAVVVGFWLRALDAQQKAETANRDLRDQMAQTDEARENALRREGEAKRAEQLVSLQKRDIEQALRGERAAKQSLQGAQQELLRTKYYHDVALAHREWGEGNVERADQLLAACPKELRGWEWWHCRSVAHPEAAAFVVPKCLDLTYSPGGARLVVLTDDAQVEYRDPDSGALLKRVPVPTRAPLRRWLSADGRRLLTAALDPKYDHEPLPADRSRASAADVRDGETGELLVSWNSVDGVFPECAVSADGAVAVISGDQENSRARSYDLKTGRLIAELPERLSSPYAALTGDGKLALAVTMDEERFVSTTLWETTTGRVVQRLRCAHNGLPVSMSQSALSPDGAHVVFASDKGDLGFWKVGQPAPFRYLTGTHTGGGCRIAFSADGSRCATAGGEDGIRVWKVGTGEPVGTLHGHRGRVNKLLFHPTRDELLTLDSLGRCKVWRGGGSRAVGSFEPPTPCPVPVAVNDRADTMFVPHIFPDQANALLFQRAGAKRTLVPKAEGVAHHLFQPGGNLLAVATAGEASPVLRLLDAATGAPVRAIATPAPLGALAFSADGSRVAGALVGNELMAWEVATGKELFRATGPPVAGVGAMSGDGTRIAWASAVRFAAIYDVASRRKLCGLRLNPPAAICAAALNRDGSRIALGTADRMVYLFDVPADGAGQLVPLEADTALAHAAAVRALAFSATGDRLVSGSDDGTVKVWDPHARHEILALKLPHREPVRRLLFSRDGNRLIAVGETRGAVIFDGTPAP
ncbi:serine/threonine-protein kinase [Gemmata sp. JC673]|uniref:Serine/threonine-protein kinase n=1 Tax=Gemmata algarum TaxID=2975278 RepID=A0ABU5F7H0_9BACT|nr:serine/threonine-protein kinase [Gemmata algarum]MDY3563545.1 serine/threonine-protein kinase [Gemmata algarum]